MPTIAVGYFHALMAASFRFPDPSPPLPSKFLTESVLVVVVCRSTNDSSEETKTVLHRDGVGNAVLIAVYRDSVRGAFYLASLYDVDPDWGNLAAQPSATTL